MRRRVRDYPQGGIFRSYELSRLMAMIGMLVILGMIIYRAAKPETWRGLIPDPGDEKAAAAGASADVEHAPKPNAATPKQEKSKPEKLAAANPAAVRPAAANPAPEASAAPKPKAKDSAAERLESDRRAAEKLAAEKRAAKEPTPKNDSSLTATGPYDEDPAEIMAMEMDREAIGDYEMKMDGSEMDAYKRCLKWAKNQPWALLEKRAKKNATLDDFYSDPDKLRMQLVELNLDVQLVQRCEKVPGIKDQLYEIWGSREGSGNRLYTAIVIDKPPDMPAGKVHLTAKVIGYFFKLQSYEPANAKPNAKPLSAPLVIGRIQWRAAPPASSGLAGLGLVLVLATGVVVVLVVLGAMFMGRKRSLVASSLAVGRDPSSPTLEDWLERPTDPEGILLGNNFPGNGDSSNGESNHEGTGAGGPPTFPGDFGTIGR